MRSEARGETIGSCYTFGAAYCDSFSPVSLLTGYLGDAGASSSGFGSFQTFEVVVPAGQSLQFVLMTVGGVIGARQGYLVEGFPDAATGLLTPIPYDLVGAPEPSTMLLGTLGLGLLGLLRLRRRA